MNVLMMSIIMVLALTACSTSTPKDAAMKSANHLKSGNYEAFVDDLAFNKELSKDEMKEQKAMLVSLLKEKGEKSIEQNGGIKKIEFVSEKISEDGNTAKVVLNYIYGNGETDENTFDLIKSNDKWKVTIKK